jgi:hypothetical protein
MDTELKQKKPLKDLLFERIETEQVLPKSRLFFQGQECFFWSLWFLSVFVGALAVAVFVFVVSHFQYEFYEATHENFLTFMVDALPYIWLIVFALMVYVSVYNLHHTKHGYRYPLWLILVSSVVLSLAGGSVLQFFGFGFTVDNILGHQMPMYISRDKLEQKFWQAPEEGRLVGKQIFSTLSPTTTIVFEDFSGQRWNIDINELHQHELDFLGSGQPVRLLGMANDIGLGLFYACGAFPFMFEIDMSMSDMFNQRQMFVERVGQHSKQFEKHLMIQGENDSASTSMQKRSVCADLEVVRRIPMRQ